MEKSNWWTDDIKKEKATFGSLIEKKDRLFEWKRRNELAYLFARTPPSCRPWALKKGSECYGIGRMDICSKA